MKDRTKFTLSLRPVSTIVLIFVTIVLCLGESMCPKESASAKAPTIKLIASFCTYYGESAQNRKDNIALACRKIDGTILYPEEEFSFNDSVGKRTSENGFKSAYIIQDGQFVEGTGGGVCQVSSTLYNCALLSSLAITCVRAHSLPVSYVAPSFDAMVSTASDLRFVNTLSSPITIRMSADGNYVRAQMYGVESFDIKRRSQTLEIIPFEIQYIEDANLNEGEEIIDTYGKNGLKSQGFLDYYQNGKLVKSILVRQDYYAPQKRIVFKGASPLTDEGN